MIYNTEQKVDETSTNNCKEEVLFNSDTLSRIISFLPSVDLLNLALTCKKFGIHHDVDKLSVIKKSVHILVHEIATEEQLAAIPSYDGESSLADYHYLQLMREPLTFDQFTRGAKYVNEEDKTCVEHNGSKYVIYATAFSNNILRAGKHYATFNIGSHDVYVGVMRPGKVDKYARGCPIDKTFFQKFSRRLGHGENNDNIVQCCMYKVCRRTCYSSSWPEDLETSVVKLIERWDGMESISSGDQLGMLLDLNEGTLSIYKNGRNLGVIKRGLAGHYCWTVTVGRDSSISIKRGTIPP